MALYIERQGLRIRWTRAESPLSGVSPQVPPMDIDLLSQRQLASKVRDDCEFMWRHGEVVYGESDDSHPRILPKPPTRNYRLELVREGLQLIAQALVRGNR